MPATEELLSVRRALAALELLAGSPEGRGVSDIARELGVHKSSASRLLATLRSGGLVDVDAASGRVGLGVGFLRLAARVVERLDLAQLSLPFMRELSARFGETAYLSVRRGPVRVAIQEVESANPVRMVAGIGRPYPLFAGAPSKILLAALPDDAIASLLAGAPRPPHGMAKLRAEIERVRRDDYAMSREENVPSATAVAVPIRGHAGGVVAALGIAGVTPRWERPQMLGALPALRESARHIGELLGQPLGADPAISSERRRA